MQGQQFESNSESNSAENGARVGERANERPVEQSLSFLDVIASESELKQSKYGQAKSVASPGSAKAPPEGAAVACPTSAEYEQRINQVARRIFDPTTLGDLNELKTKYNCDIQRTSDPIKYVKLALDVDDKDPYTSYLTPDAFAKFQKAQKGEVVGVGVEFVMPTAADDKTGKNPPLIVQSFDGTDARGRGLQPGDQVLAINGEDMQGKSWRDGANALGGADRTQVNLRILRDGMVRDVVLTRTSEEPANVSSEMLDGNFAHIKVRNFMTDDTSNQIEQAIIDNPNAKGYILDLRHNGGGLLNQAFTSASVFMTDGKVATIRTRLDSDPAHPLYETDVYRIGRDGITKTINNQEPLPYFDRHPDRVDKPVVVLVDQGTASAAEILAGALKDSDGAYVVGTPTFGKGIGQALFPDRFDQGATKVTTFRYYTPSGFWPGDGHDSRIGLQPNLVVDNPTPQLYNTNKDSQINAAIGYLRTKVAAEKGPR
ncbi:PDZ domain-containing protein [bacterium]|nr:PDZ domain-containing protein [bacterium]MBP9808232.1 PDZ domain-containing protein [bacterium]